MKILTMKKKLLVSCFTFILLSGTAFAQTGPVIQWQKTFGGNKMDSLIAILPTNDNGFIVSGFSKSDSSSTKSKNSYGGTYDFWIVKINYKGKVLWDKTIGGLGSDTEPTIIQTKDAGFLVGGKSNSDISGNKTENAINESEDYWVIKLDKDGNIMWNNTIGGIQLEGVKGLTVVPERGTLYMVAGYSYSGYGDDKTDFNRGANLWSDYWMVKLDARGKIKWNRTIGGKNEDRLSGMVLSADSAYMLGGYSYSPSGYEKTDSFIGNNDYWFVKMDRNGEKVWDKVYGGALSDYQTTVAAAADKGFLLGGYSNSPAGFSKSGALKGVTDFWIVKVDANGNKQWDKTFGGTLGDFMTYAQQTSDKGYILGGYSNSGISGDKSENSRGGDDIWIVKVDSLGRKQWDKTIGGNATDRLSMIREISPGEYIVGATSNSPKSGDKTSRTIGNTGFNDYWVIRLGPAAQVAEATEESEDAVVSTTKQDDFTKLTLKASPNPTKGIVTVTFAGGADNSKLKLDIYDNSGKSVLRSTLSGGKGSQTFDLTRQPSGMYYITLTQGNSTATRIIVKD